MVRVRRVLVVRIMGSWDVGSNGNSAPGQTNPTVWNAVVGCSSCNPPASGAVQRWNNARDSSGWPTNYYFQVDQSSQNPDIIIDRDATVSGTYGESYNMDRPRRIVLDPRNADAGPGMSS